MNVKCITINVLYSLYDFNLFFSFKFLEELRNESRMRDSSVVSRNTGADSDVITVETEEVDEIHFGQIPQTPSHSWPKAIGIVQICSGFLTTILGTCFDFFSLISKQMGTQAEGWVFISQPKQTSDVKTGNDSSNAKYSATCASATGPRRWP